MSENRFGFDEFDDDAEDYGSAALKLLRNAEGAPTVADPQPGEEDDPSATSDPTATPAAAPARAPRPKKATTSGRRASPSRSRKTASTTQGPQPASPPASSLAETPLEHSSAQVPMSLQRAANDYCRTEGITKGALVIAAIEATVDRLPDALTGSTVGGGSVFEAQPVTARRRGSPSDPLVPFYYQLRQAHFKNLDDACTRLGATSRGHLLTEAFRLFLDQQPEE